MTSDSHGIILLINKFLLLLAALQAAPDCPVVPVDSISSKDNHTGYRAHPFQCNCLEKLLSRMLKLSKLAAPKKR